MPAPRSLLLLAAPGRDGPLLHEVRRALPAAVPRAVAPGLLWCEAPAGDLALAFATQVLPDPRALSAPSVSRWAEAAAAQVLEALAPARTEQVPVGGEPLSVAASDGPPPWRLHVLAMAAPGSRLGTGRAALLRQALLARLKEQRRALLRALIAEDATPWGARDVLVQLVLTDLDAGWLSVCPPERRATLRHVLSRFPAGAVEVPEDKGPPSRAYRKLLEAELHLGRAIAAGERCVDLGASPGGWSAVALARGAHVLAVDRAPLREDLMAHPHLEFRQGDAFRHAPDPDAPCDWLLCDVIAFPERTLQLLERWLTARACRRYVVTLKFRGEEDYPRLEGCKALLARHGGEFLLRQFGANRNEVTACGALLPG